MMAELSQSQAYALAAEIAGMVRREGTHDFKHEHGAAAASLCGLCVHTENQGLLRIHACDLDIEFLKPANDHAGMRFTKGTLADLQSWHGRLGRLQASFATREAA
jgi:hypothetical protein